MKKILLKTLLLTSWLVATQTQVQAQKCTTKESEARSKRVGAIDTTNSRGLADNFWLWDVGKVINVRFLNGTEEQQRNVLSIAKEWESYANIKFNLVMSEPSNIRVKFSDEKQNYSLIGTTANMESSSEHTMHLSNALFANPAHLRRTVQHEFGHAIGLLHEHSSPVSGIKWNKDTIYKINAAYGWDKDMVDANIFEVYDVRYTNGTAYDPKSIMHYPIDAYETLDGYNVGWNTSISEGDKKLIGMLYPFTGARTNERPRVNILDYTNTLIEENKSAGGIYLYPSFRITTAGNSGDILFMLKVYDKNGYCISNNSGTYSANGCLASYAEMRIAPGIDEGINKGDPRQVPFFVPYNLIPNVPNNSEIQVQFTVFVSDGKEIKDIFRSPVSQYRMGPR